MANGPVTILDLAPCLQEPGFRLLAADQILAVFEAILDGTLPIATPPAPPPPPAADD